MTDDNDDPGRKKNTDRDFKPTEGKRIDFSPRGTVGRNPTGMQGPGLGTSPRQQKSFEQVQNPTSDQEPQNNLPYAIETGNKDQDDALRKDHNVVTRKEAEGMIGKEAVARIHGEEGPSSNNSAEVEDTQKNPQGSAGMSDQDEKPPERPRISQSDYAKAFRKARDQTQSMGQSKGLKLE